MAQVGKSFIKDEKTGKERLFKYSDICKKNTWVSAKEHLPMPFDLMDLKIEEQAKILPGWHDCNKWTGPRVKKNHKIDKWKRVIYAD